MNQTSVSASITRVDLVGTCVSLICAFTVTAPSADGVPWLARGILGIAGDPVHLRASGDTGDGGYLSCSAPH